MTVILIRPLICPWVVFDGISTICKGCRKRENPLPLTITAMPVLPGLDSPEGGVLIPEAQEYG
jgi:hypothetical protein